MAIWSTFCGWKRVTQTPKQMQTAATAVTRDRGVRNVRDDIRPSGFCGRVWMLTFMTTSALMRGAVAAMASSNNDFLPHEMSSGVSRTSCKMEIGTTTSNASNI